MLSKELKKYMKLPTIKNDKANHFIYGFAIFVLLNIFLIDLASLAIVVFIAFTKEIYDEYDYGGFDFVDAIYTIIPALILILIK